MRKLLVAALAAAVLVAPRTGAASGFKIAEQGAKGGGMGIAFVAQADDPTTIALNPAGMHQLPGTQTALTSALIYAPGNHFDSDIAAVKDDQDADNQLFAVPSLFVTTDFGFPKFHFGLGVYSLFGLSRDWDDAGIGGIGQGVPAAGFARTTSRADLNSIFVNPVVSYDICGDKLSIAAGAIYAHGRIEVSGKPVVNLGAAGIQKLADINQEAQGDGWGYNIGVHSQLTDKLRLGAYWRSEINLDMDNGGFRASNQNPLVFGAAAVDGRVFRSNLTVDFTLPGTVGFGAAYEVTPDLTVEVDGEFNTWSEFDDLNADIENPLLSAGGAVLIDDANLTQHPEWDDSWAARIGFQYKLCPKFAVRAGYFYDETPVPDETFIPAVPDGSRNGLTLGAGMTEDWWSMDVAYMAVFPDDRDIDNNASAPQIPIVDGTFSSDPIHVFMLTSTVRF